MNIAHNRREFNGIDCMKLIMAVFVVAIHTAPQSVIRYPYVPSLLESVYSLAVPFFFTASGFLLFNNLGDDTPKREKLRRLTKYIRKAVRLYLIWTTIYLPFTVYGLYLDNVGFVKSVAIFLRNIVFIGENYLSWHLWFLLAMIVAGGLIYLMVLLDWKSLSMYIVAILLFVIGFGLDYLHSLGFAEIYYKIFDTTRNGLFQGFPFIMVGIFIAQGNIVSKQYQVILFILSLVIYMCGVKLMALLVIYSLFSMVISMAFKKRPDNLYANIRLTSTVVYFTHMVWVGLIKILLPELSPLALFLIALLLSVATSRIALRYKDNAFVRLSFGR